MSEELIRVENLKKDFGSLTVGYEMPASQTFTVTNSGSSDLTLLRPLSVDLYPLLSDELVHKGKGQPPNRFRNELVESLPAII